MDVRESARFESDTEIKMFEVYQTRERGGPRAAEKDREVHTLAMWEIWTLEPKLGSLQWTSTCKLRGARSLSRGAQSEELAFRVTARSSMFWDTDSSAMDAPNNQGSDGELEGEGQKRCAENEV